MKTLSIVFATVLTSALVGSAHAAAPAQEIRQREVSFADLDLSHEAGAERLYRRIRTAAREVCGTPGVLEVLTASRRRQCAQQATARAIAEVDAPSLTRYYVARSATAHDAGAHRTAVAQSDGDGPKIEQRE